MKPLLPLIYSIAFCISIFLISCNDDVSGDKLGLEPLSEYFQQDSTFKFQKLIIDSSRIPETLSSDTPTSRDELSSMRTVVKILNGSSNAGITIPGFGGLKLGKDEQSLNVYYLETKVVDTNVYAIGYSLHYLFRKLKRGISITNLPQVAASVQLEGNKSQVIYSQQSYGIKSLSLVNYFKPVVNTDFNVDGFGTMQSSIDGIHNVLSDSTLSSKTKFGPMIISFVKPNDLN